MMQSEKDTLINSFEKKMISYFPNWNTIIDANNVTTKTFGQRLKRLRKSRGLNQVEMGERLSYKKQNISKIENGKNKQIPVDKLDFISDIFSVSIAYLLGLEDDDGVHFDKRHYYFWENPNSEYGLVKEDILNKPLIYPMETWGSPKEEMINIVIEELKTDYDLLDSLYRIFTIEKTKRKNFIDIIKALKNIL